MKNILLYSFLITSFGLTAQVPSYVPQDSLVGWWGFNGNANDESGNGNDGTVNGATLTDDRFGNTNSAYDFDGVNDFIEVNDNPTLRISNTDFALSAWVKMANYSSNFQSMVLSKRSSSSGANGYCFIVKGNVASPPGYVSFEASGGSDPESHTNSGIGLGVWNHIFVNFNLTTSEISTYINGAFFAVSDLVGRFYKPRGVEDNHLRKHPEYFASTRNTPVTCIHSLCTLPEKLRSRKIQ